MEKRLDRFAIASSTVVTYLITVGSVSAQIVPDHTLPVNSRVTPGCTTCTIEGGTVRGSNLFHSFREFSVPVGGEAFFNNPPEIENIFSRVTGSNLSYINGWIRANGTANLFLLNPNGIIFGPNAQLDIQGSFLASTANSFTFADGSEFGATNPQGPPLLTISVPFGLQYGNNPGNIEVRGSHLQVNPGKTLALVGGDLSIDGGQLQADGGQIQLGGVTGEGTVGSVANSYEPSLNFPLADDLPLSDVSLHNGTKINVSANGDGKIAIDARNLTMAGESRLQAGSSGLESSNSNPGDIEINATEAINLTESSSIENLVFSEAMGKGGDINIRTRSLSLSGGANVVAHTFGRGNAGNVTINASGAISLDGASTGIGSQVFENAVGNGGNITITTGTLSLSDGATLPANTFGRGNAGNVTINASGAISLDGASTGIGSQVFENAVGNGGNITITTGTLSLSGGATLVANTSGRGNAGNVTINASDAVSLDGVGTGTQVTGIGSQTLAGGVGNGGNIEITAESLLMTNGARLISATSGQGNGGNVNIVVRDTVSFDGVGSNGQNSGVFSSVESGGAGEGGDIRVSANTLNLSNEAVLDAQTETSFKAGEILINAAQSVNLNQASLLALSTDQSATAGDAGNITINTGELTARNGRFATSSEQSSGGNINITADQIRLFDDSGITTNVNQGAGDGGNINLKADSILAFDNSDILAFANDGQGGDITLDSPAFFGQNYSPVSRNRNTDSLDNNNRVDVNATGVVSGVIVISDTTFIQNSLADLPENQIDTDILLANSCIVRRDQPRGSFMITGTGGLPQRPGNMQMSTFSTVDVETLPDDDKPSTANPRRSWQVGDPIVEPQGLYRLPNGKVVLSRECPE